MVRGLLSTLFATAAGATVSQKVELSDGMCFVEEKRSMSMWPTWTLHISVVTDLSSNSKITSDVRLQTEIFPFFFFIVSLFSRNRSFTNIIPQQLPLVCKLCNSGYTHKILLEPIQC